MQTSKVDLPFIDCIRLTSIGCNGERTYYDGSSMIFVNGSLKAQGAQFSTQDVEVITATVDLEEVRAFRCSISRGMQAVRPGAQYRRIDVTEFQLSLQEQDYNTNLSPTIHPRIHSLEEEMAGPALWLWDYLRSVFLIRLVPSGIHVDCLQTLLSCRTSSSLEVIW